MGRKESNQTNRRQQNCEKIPSMQELRYNFLILDINECEEDKTLCTGERQHCENNDGSYECICETGYVLDVENNCIPKPKGKVFEYFLILSFVLLNPDICLLVFIGAVCPSPLV